MAFEKLGLNLALWCNFESPALLQKLFPFSYPADGKVFGLESFGFSAPYTVLDEKLGFTAQNVYNQVKEILK